MAKLLSITREKHLDHMVRMMPIFVLFYAIQCFITLSLGLFGAVAEFIFLLGGSLVFMVAGFCFYNIKHKVDFFDAHLEVNFLGINKAIAYEEIFLIEVDGKEDDSFATLVITCKDLHQYKFYLIDDAFKIKDWLQNKIRGGQVKVAA